MAFALNKLVKNIMVMGFDIVRKKAERKLHTIFVDGISIFVDVFPSVFSIIMIPNIINTIELMIPNVFFIFLFSSNFQLPNIANMI